MTINFERWKEIMEEVKDNIPERVLTSRQFARRIFVSPTTLVNWEDAGILLPVFKTPTGHRRYTEQQVNDYFENARVKK